MSFESNVPFFPDWALAGFREGEHYAIVASRELSHGELRLRVETHDIMGLDSLDPVRRIEGRRVFTLSVEMRRYSIAYGSSYADAFSKLMATWSPDSDTGASPPSFTGVLRAPALGAVDELPPG